MTRRAADILRRAAGRQLLDMRGQPVRIELLPPATEAQVRELEDRLERRVPPDVREALGVAAGLAAGPVEVINLLGAGDFGLEELFPRSHPVAADGFGNFWIVDQTGDGDTWGPIYFACHDPPVIVYQSPDLGSFLADALEPLDPETRSLLDIVRQDATRAIWAENPAAQSVAACAEGPDPVLREFARSLSPEWEIADLRPARTGDGFSWGRYGPRAGLRRWGNLPVFAVEARRSSWIQRLLGR